MRPLVAALPAVLVVASCGAKGAAETEREAPVGEQPATTAPAREPVLAPARKPQKPLRLRLARVATGLQAPVHLASTPSEPHRLYVVEQAGRIRVLVRGKARATSFLDIRARVRSGGEQGLLSLAFHPRYAQNRKLYVNYTDRNGNTRVVQYRSNGFRVLPGSGRELLRVRQPYANHNGGQLAFGPDGRLYVGMGDGGAGGDPHNNAQRLSTKLGKLLRRDVDRAGTRWRIVGYGLRNPWRFSFDRATGDLWLADVGQNSWEEVNFVARGSVRLPNFGWRVWEGRARYTNEAPSRRGKLVFPLAVYGRGKGCSVTGGFVYHGRLMSALRGRYFYGDYCSGNVWSLRARNGKAAGLRREPFRVRGLTSFGEDARGELYLVSHGGTIFRLRSA